MKEYLRLLGWQSLALILVLSLMIRACLTIPFYKMYFPMTIIPSGDYLLFTFSLMLLMAGFSVICSYFDTKMSDILANTETLDNIKKLRLFYVLVVLGLGALSYISFKYHVWQIGAIGLVFAGLSYIYAYKYKRQDLIGNISIALLFSLLAFMPFLLEFFAFTHYQSEILIQIPTSAWLTFFKLFAFFAGFVFLLTFIRDLTADVANIEQNKKDGFMTFAVRHGEKLTNKVLVVCSLVFMLFNAYFLYRMFDYMEIIHIVILSLTNIVPFIYYIYKLLSAKRTEEVIMLYQLLGMIYISLLFTIFYSQNLFTIDVI